MSIVYSVPEWIVKQFYEQYGFDVTEKILTAFLKENDTTIRCNVNRVSPDELIDILKGEDISASKSKYLDFGLKISGYNYLDAVKSFKDGLYQIQDISSMFVAKIANPKPDSYVIDVCAAPGGKALHMAELLSETGYVEARDVSENKVALIKDNIDRMQASNVGARVMDALALDELSVDKADIVIADLPCSGLGVIGKKKDIKYKMTFEKQQELEQLQKNILSVVNNYVHVGGYLIYSTCTINERENIENVRWFMKKYHFELESISEYLPEELRSKETDEGYLQLLPGVHDCDGFFIARLKKVL